MKILTLIFGVIITQILWISCSSVGKQGDKTAVSEGVRLPETQEVVLNSGLKILFIRDTSLPRINIMALVGSGTINDPKDKAGLNYLTASLLDEGTEKHSSREIAERLEGLGADLSIQPGYDFTYLSLRGLSYNRATLVDSFLEVLLSPKFEPTELGRLKKQVQGSLSKIADDPDRFADLLFSKVIFQDHPYALPTMGSIASLERIQRSDIMSFYKNYYVPKNVMVAVVGDFDSAFAQQVKTKLSTWISESSFNGHLRPLGSPSNAPGRIKLENKKGLVQAQIRLGHRFVERASPDFLSLRVANMALGGAFASRLNQHVRDDLGLTYGINSSFDARKELGPFTIETFTRNDKVAEAIRATLDVYTAFVDKGISKEELDASKSVLIGQFPRAIETTDLLAYQMLALRYYHIDDSYLTHFVSNVQALDLQMVNAAIKRHFQPSHLQIVVYGDEGTIGPQLKKIQSQKTL